MSSEFSLHLHQILKTKQCSIVRVKMKLAHRVVYVQRNNNVEVLFADNPMHGYEEQITNA